jgi:hypothetical protein
LTATAGAGQGGATVQPSETHTPGPQATPTPDKTVFTLIEDAWLEHNVLYDDGYYLLVHSSFTISRADSARAWVVARFWLADTSPMPQQMHDYSLEGQAAVWDTVDVMLSPASYWDDFYLSIPYDALAAGEWHYATVELRDVDTDMLLDWFDTESFDVNH